LPVDVCRRAKVEGLFPHTDAAGRIEHEVAFFGIALDINAHDIGRTPSEK
jgi:hypothetical protein